MTHTIGNRVLLRKAREDKTRGGIMMVTPESELREATVVKNALNPFGLITLKSGQRVWINPKAKVLGTLGDADLVEYDDVVMVEEEK